MLSLLMVLGEREFEAGLKPSYEVVSSALGVEAQFFVGELPAEATGLKRAYAYWRVGRGYRASEEWEGSYWVQGETRPIRKLRGF